MLSQKTQVRMKKMAKKDLNEDILSGGSISDSAKSEKSAKKAEKLAEKAKKNAEKKAALDKEIQELRSKLASETDEKAKTALKKKLDRAKAKQDALSGKKSAIAAQNASIIRKVVACVIVVALVVAYVGTGAVRKGFIHSTLQWTTGITAATITDESGDKIKIPVSTYNYYFATTYNNLKSTQSAYKQYGLDPKDYNLDVDFDKKLSSQKTTNSDDEVVTWLEYVNEQTLNSIKTTYMYYNEAVKANNGEEPEITDEQKSELEETIENYKSSAAQYGYTVSGYLVQAMGKGVTEKVFRREMTRSYIAQNYQSQLNTDADNKEYTEADYTTYKDAHTDDLNAVSIRIFEASSEDDAKAFKDELKSDGSNFTDLCVKYAQDGDYYKSYYAQAETSTKLYATKSILKSAKYAIATADSKDSDSYPGLDWLFSTERKAGDIYQTSTSVVYVLSPVALPEASSVNVRHILVSPITDSSSNTQAVDATAEQWATALETANKVVSEYNSGDKTEDSFAALVSKYSSDTGSTSNGGLYENVVPGQMVDSFEAWSLDSSRKAGDIGIVQTQYGYHIMYFVGTTGTPIWEENAKSALTSEDSSSAADQLEKAYTAKMNWFGKCYIEIDTDIDR